MNVCLFGIVFGLQLFKLEMGLSVNKNILDAGNVLIRTCPLDFSCYFLLRLLRRRYTIHPIDIDLVLLLNWFSFQFECSRY